MTTVFFLHAGTLGYPSGGGYFWTRLNRALGLRSAGCRVIWMEGVDTAVSMEGTRDLVEALRSWLEQYGLGKSLGLCSWDGSPLPSATAEASVSLAEAVASADLLLIQRYGPSVDIIRRFLRTALLDIDPGLLQIWMSRQWIPVAPHDIRSAYETHSASARGIAAEYFEAQRTAGRLLGSIGMG